MTTTIKCKSDKQVRKVKAWRRKAESQELWDALNGVNNAIFATLKDMRENGGGGAREEDRDAALQQLFLKARELLKQMGTLAGVEIEPQEQTELCTATTMLKNVIVCGVPGAGGNDAVFALYRGGDQTRVRLQRQRRGASRPQSVSVLENTSQRRVGRNGGRGTVFGCAQCRWWGHRTGNRG